MKGFVPASGVEVGIWGLVALIELLLQHVWLQAGRQHVV
jgi:hypothetical protein